MDLLSWSPKRGLSRRCRWIFDLYFMGLGKPALELRFFWCFEKLSSLLFLSTQAFLADSIFASLSSCSKAIFVPFNRNDHASEFAWFDISGLIALFAKLILDLLDFCSYPIFSNVCKNVQWGSFSCRWHYWSRTCCIFKLLKSFHQSKLIWD